MLDAETGKLLEVADLDPVLIDDSKAVSGKLWIINLLTYSDREQAESLVKNLGHKDFLAKVVQAKPDLYQARIENLNSYSAAMVCRARLLEITDIQPADITIVTLPEVQTQELATLPAPEEKGGDKNALLSSGSSQPVEEPSAALAVSEPEPLIAEVNLNTMEKGSFFMMATADGDLLLDRQVAEGIGLNLPATGDTAISLKSLAPDITYELDAASGTLAIHADPKLLPRQIEELQLRLPSDATRLQESALYLNYDVNYNKIHGSVANYNAPLELGANWNGLSLINNFSWQKSTRIVRSQSQLVHDDRERLRRWIAGDISASSGNRLGSASLGGIRLFKNYGMQPSIFTGPPLAMSANLLTPSEVEVYIDGNMVYKGEFQPGELDLRNIPYYRSGLGEAKIIVRDAFGRESIINDTFYSSTSLLAEGLHSYDYAIGVARSPNAIGELQYGSKPRFYGSHRFGLTDWFTPGLGIESDGRDLRGGLTGDLLLGDFGQLGIVAAGSRRQGLRGGMLQADYSFTSTGILSPSLFFNTQTQHYGGLIDRQILATTAARWRGGAGLAASLGALGSISSRWSRSRTFDNLWAQDATLNFSTQLPGQVSLSTQLTRTWQQLVRPENRIYASLGHSFSNGLYLSANFSRDNNSNTFGLQLQQSPPLGNGVGYSASATMPQQRDTTTLTRLQYHHDFGELQVGRSGSNKSPGYDARMSGALLLTGGGLNLSRPMRDSFAVVRVPGMKNVKVRVQNQEVGKTDADGTLPLPYLHAYMDNTITIDTAEIPLGYSIDSTSKVVTTGYRGGGVVDFQLRKMQIISGKAFYLRDGELESAQYSGLELSGNGTSQKTVIGFGGEIYVESITAGNYQARIFNERRDCHFTLVVPESKSFINDLGDVTCDLGTKKKKENP